jgi:hypothetical protein
MQRYSNGMKALGIGPMIEPFGNIDCQIGELG